MDYNYHIYDDDCQLYSTFNATKGADCMANMEALIWYIRGWYTENVLKLNEGKSKYRQNEVSFL